MLFFLQKCWPIWVICPVLQNPLPHRDAGTILAASVCQKANEV